MENEKKNDGGAAFPTLDFDVHSETGQVAHFSKGGMSLRDWFAGQALATYEGFTKNQNGWQDPQYTAECCYELADAMLAEREK